MSLPVPLNRPGFRLFLLAQQVSLIGDFFMPIALSFAVLKLTGSTRDLGIVVAAQVAPTSVLLLFGGAWADRFPRRALMVCSDVARAMTQGIVAALVLSGTARVWELVALMAAWGTAEAIARPASFAYWPELVSADEVEAAASFEASTWSSSLIVGPVLAGVLVAAFSPGAAIAIDAATFLVSAAAIAASRPLVSRPPREEGGSTVRDIREGWRELCARPWLVITYTVTAFQSLIWFGPLMVLGPAYASVHLGGASGWAVVMACWGVGGLVGGFTALRVRASRPLVGAMIAIAAIGPAGVLWIVAPHLAVVAMASIVAGGGYFYSDAVQMAVVPQHVPDDVRSRVGAYGWLSFYSLQPIGMASAGVLAATFAPEAILAVTGMVVSLVALAAIATPAVNRLARVEPSSR